MNDDSLVTISVKIPRWAEDEFKRVCGDTGLDFSKAVRIGLMEIAKILKRHWRRGPALPSFLESLEFHPEQYDIFFEKRK